MVREFLTEAVSYKSRAIKLDGIWIDASKDFDIKEARIGKVQPYELSQTLKGDYKIIRIIKKKD